MPSGGGMGFRGSGADLDAEAAADVLEDDMAVALVWDDDAAAAAEEVVEEEEVEELVEAFLMLACGVFEVNKVASATLRGLPTLAMYTSLSHTHSRARGGSGGILGSDSGPTELVDI